jgi:hypothetical protein
MADTQLTELAGRHFLIARLLDDGVEVATPVRDHGIDLIAYVDRTETTGQFFACPIQLKTANEERFILHSKYEKFPNLLMVYAWNISDDDKRVLYALTYSEAKKLLQKGVKGTDHTETDSWKKRGVYHFEVSDKWKKVLTPYQMNKRGQWFTKVLEVSKLQASNHELVTAVKE